MIANLLFQRVLILFFFCFFQKISLSQSGEVELRDGLYQSTPDWIVVHQLVSDTFKAFKITQSKYHYDKAKVILSATVPDIDVSDLSGKKPREMRIEEVVKIDDQRFSLIYKINDVYSAVNYTRKDIGYEFFQKSYRVSRVDLPEAIKKDSADYFTLTAFSLGDMSVLKGFKNFNQITKVEFNALMKYAKAKGKRCSKQLTNNEPESIYPTVVSNEILVKVLIDLKYNPMILPGDFDKIYNKYKSGK